MKIIAYGHLRPGVTMETIQPLLAEEVAKCLAVMEGRGGAGKLCPGR